MWLECIPNFSEGRNPVVLDEMLHAAQATGVKVLGFEGDRDHHRSVMTMAGEGEMIIEAMMAIARVATKRINLNAHQGVHPRMGAIDVVPFVPLGETPMSYAVEVAHKLGERLASELRLPIYFYEEAARDPSRQNLADIRRGQFEALTAKMAQWPPDIGPIAPHPTAGATAVGARRPLIAFNVVLNTDDMTVARAVARAVRGSSGGLKGVKALAMDTSPSLGKVQVSMNLVDYPQTTLPQALEMVRQEASRFGVMIAETELVGFLPLQALIDSAHYYWGLRHLTPHQVLEMALFDGNSPFVKKGWNS